MNTTTGIRIQPCNGSSRHLFWNVLSFRLPRSGPVVCGYSSQLFKTADPILYATLLLRSEGARYLLEAVDRDGRYHYFPEMEESTNIVLARLMGLSIGQRYRVSNIRKRFRERFYGFRSALRAADSVPFYYSIDGTVVRSGKPGVFRTDQSALWAFGAALTHPFSLGTDPFLESLAGKPLYDWINEGTEDSCRESATAPTTAS